MEDKITVYCLNDKTYYEVPAGVSLLEVQELIGIKMPYLVSCAKVNNKTESLHYRIYHPKHIEFIDISDESGMRCYVRSLCFILAKAVYDIYPDTEINIKHSLSKGYYFTLEGKSDNEALDIQKIKERMHQLIEENVVFEPVEDETETVVTLFRERGFEDKALLLETSDALYSKYYRLGNYIDYFYGTLLPSSGCITIFDIIPMYEGYLLRIPNRNMPFELEPVIEQPKMFRVFKEQSEFLRIIGLENVGELNRANRNESMSEIIKVSEALQEKSIAEFANLIKLKYDNGVRIVMIAGPSSSGKTTFRKRLEVQLMTNLINPVGLSLDDYFVNREDTPLDENGDYDFESLYALDLELFNNDLTALLKGKEVQIPTFNFTNGRREYKGHSLRIKPRSVLLIEGIHGLNPELTKNIGHSQKFLIYVSALTAIRLDNHNWIPTTDNRLLRRLVRDYKYRNYSAVETLSRWSSVRKGEDKWIFPFQENADVMFNSAMIYELAALKKYAEPILMEVPKKVPEYSEAYRLLRFLSYFNNINDRELPPTSLLREFLGGSSFKY